MHGTHQHTCSMTTAPTFLLSSVSRIAASGSSCNTVSAFAASRGSFRHPRRKPYKCIMATGGLQNMTVRRAASRPGYNLNLIAAQQAAGRNTGRWVYAGCTCPKSSIVGTSSAHLHSLSSAARPLACPASAARTRYDAADGQCQRPNRWLSAAAAAC
jgi:hypothetical protein